MVFQAKSQAKIISIESDREVADQALGLENPELCGDRELARMTVEAERMTAVANQGQRSALTFVMKEMH